jgi:two-component system, OmpR family, sensor histidine kinase BaeS
VHAEPVRLGRILGNLLDNAVTHGGGHVRVRARRDGADVIVDVIDDGPGIQEADLPLVFERFYKSDRSRSSGGSGLGLAIAREHARAHGGDLTVANEPGAGARFTLRLEAADVDRDEVETSA